jgi:hypothetical protein
MPDSKGESLTPDGHIRLKFFGRGLVLMTIPACYINFGKNPP